MLSVFIEMSIIGYESENTEVALLANASRFEIIQDGIVEEFYLLIISFV